MRKWIKFYPVEWLEGTTREELNEKEQNVWIDLLALAGASRFDGIIAAGQDINGEYIGYSIPRLCGKLNRPVEGFLEILQKLASPRIDKIKLHQTNIENKDLYWIEITNWNKYQSEYSRIKKYIKKNENKNKVKEPKKLIQNIQFPISNEIAQKLWAVVKQLHPAEKTPDLQKWAIEIDRMIKIDNRSVEDISKIINWLPTDFFPSDQKWKGWGEVIRSAKALREKFSVLIEKVASQPEKNIIGMYKNKITGEIVEVDVKNQNIEVTNKRGIVDVISTVKLQNEYEKIEPKKGS